MGRPNVMESRPMAQNVLRGTEILTVGRASAWKAQELVTACAACSKSASRPFESVLNQLLGDHFATRYLLADTTECPRCGSTLLEGTLVSTCDRHIDLDLSAGDRNVGFVDEDTLAEAQSFVSGCEHCEPERATISFDQLLDALTGCDPTVTEYIICHAVRCPQCSHEVMGNTLILSQ
jgi:hypothetical protein